MTDSATLLGLAICFAPVFTLALAACFHMDREALPFRSSRKREG
jgi:hypothetical protein